MEENEFGEQYAIDPERDSKRYTAEVINSVIEDEETEEKPKFMMKCPNCGFVYDDREKPKDFKGKEIDIRNYLLLKDNQKFRCPNCLKIVEYEIISEEEYKSILEKKKLKDEKIEKQKQAESERKRKRYLRINIEKFNDSLTDLTEDLKKDLLEGEITPKRFFNLYYNLAFRLYRKYSDIISEAQLNLDVSDFRYTIKKVADDILELNKTIQRSDEYLESLDEDIEQDEMYIQKSQEYVDDSDILELDADENTEREYINDQRLKDLKRKIDRRDKEERKSEYKLGREEEFTTRKYNARIDDYTKSIDINKK